MSKISEHTAEHFLRVAHDILADVSQHPNATIERQPWIAIALTLSFCAYFTREEPAMWQMIARGLGEIEGGDEQDVMVDWMFWKERLRHQLTTCDRLTHQ